MPNAVADLFAIISIYINFCRNLPVSLLNGRIILCRGINILMAQNICNKADVAGFLIKGGSVSAAELMGGDMLSGNGFLCKFFDYIFHGLHAHTLSAVR